MRVWSFMIYRGDGTGIFIPQATGFKIVDGALFIYNGDLAETVVASGAWTSLVRGEAQAE